MLNDGSGFEKSIYWRLDLRICAEGSMAWPESYVFSSSLILTIRIHYSYFAAKYRSDKRAYLGGRWISTSVQAD